MKQSSSPSAAGGKGEQLASKGKCPEGTTEFATNFGMRVPTAPPPTGIDSPASLRYHRTEPWAPIDLNLNVNY
jgi:hypothetical protein